MARPSTSSMSLPILLSGN
ncbi:hypothetical protein POUND7_002218 [Theobroma cacao]